MPFEQMPAQESGEQFVDQRHKEWVEKMRSKTNEATIWGWAAASNFTTAMFQIYQGHYAWSGLAVASATMATIAFLEYAKAQKLKGQIDEAGYMIPEKK